MKPRERVLAALEHKIPDRCPFQITFTTEFKERLLRKLQQDESRLPEPLDPAEPFALERALHQDILVAFSGRLSAKYDEPVEIREDGIKVDCWGIGRKEIVYQTKFGVGRYDEMVLHPLADASQIGSYKAPDPEDPDLYEETAYLLKNHADQYWIVGAAVTTIFETAWALRGYEQLLMDFVVDPELAEEILQIPFQYHMVVARKLAAMGVDMIWFGDDVGAQQSMLISPTLWRKVLKPKMAEIIDTVKQVNPRIKVAYHSDGDVRPIIPDLIEIGLDVLNPIQPASMSPFDLKKAYGDHLCFWGCIDEQELLPFGTPQQVKDEIRRLIAEVGHQGGLILAPTHNVQLDTPMENFQAMVETILQTSCMG